MLAYFVRVTDDEEVQDSSSRKSDSAQVLEKMT